MIKAIVFDLGGALFAEGKSVAIEKLGGKIQELEDGLQKLGVQP